jgi:hypothetical protein
MRYLFRICVTQLSSRLHHATCSTHSRILVNPLPLTIRNCLFLPSAQLLVAQLIPQLVKILVRLASSLFTTSSMAGIAIGAVGLGISVTDHAIIVLGFIHDVVVDVKRFGDQVSAVRAQVMYEVARLQTISKYLNHQTPDGAYQLYTLDPACQSAVLGLVQELEVIFAAYTACVDKHNIAALRQGYAKSLEGGLGGLVLDSRLAEGANAQAASTTRERLRWAIFNKAKITKLLKSLGDWSDRIMNLLLCVVSLGNTAAGSSETGAASITPNEM